MRFQFSLSAYSTLAAYKYQCSLAEERESSRRWTELDNGFVVPAQGVGDFVGLLDELSRKLTLIAGTPFLSDWSRRSHTE